MHGMYICLVEVKPSIERMNAGNLIKGHHGIPLFVIHIQSYTYLIDDLYQYMSVLKDYMAGYLSTFPELH